MNRVTDDSESDCPGLAFAIQCRSKGDSSRAGVRLRAPLDGLQILSINLEQSEIIIFALAYQLGVVFCFANLDVESLLQFARLCQNIAIGADDRPQHAGFFIEISLALFAAIVDQHQTLGDGH